MRSAPFKKDDKLPRLLDYSSTIRDTDGSYPDN